MITLVSVLARGWLGSLFIYSSVQKLAHYRQVGQSINEYRVLPKRLGSVAGIALPWAELLAGLSFLFAQLYPLGPILGASLGAAFAYGSSDVLRRGADVPCGCTGKASDQVSRVTLIRGLTISLLSISVLGAGRRNYRQFPLAVIILVIIVSTVPLLLTPWRNIRNSELHEQRSHRLRTEIAKLTRMLGTPPEDVVNISHLQIG